MKIDTKEIEVSKKEANLALREANELIITNAEEMKTATTLLGRIKGVQKGMLERKNKVVKPIKEGLKEFSLLFVPVEDSTEEAEDIVKKKMLAYDEVVAEAARKEEAKIAARVDKGTMKPETAAKKIVEIETVETVVETNEGAAQFRIRKVPVVVDKNVHEIPQVDSRGKSKPSIYYRKDKTVIPNEYWILDTIKMRKDALAGSVIPGINVEERKEVAGYTAKTKSEIIGE